MAFRTILIQNRCKLEYSLNYMICRKGNEEIKILIDEIKLLIIDSLQVSITTSLISELIKKKVKILFIDDKHNPLGEITPYQNNYYSYKKIMEQFNFSSSAKQYLWRCIIERKIANQSLNLHRLNLIDGYNKLEEYRHNVLNDDASNREGHAAKVYFNSLFGKGFNRDLNNEINMFLNYGYSIILSSINREIKSFGYLTELGIHHKGESNPFNLSCDLMEPIRPLVDSYIILNKVNKDNFKKVFTKMLSEYVIYNDKDIFLDNAIHLYVEDMLNYLKTGDINKIKFIEYEL